MKVLITGIAGFVGARIAKHLVEAISGIEVWGIDNLSRRGSETNIEPLRRLGARFQHGDIRFPGDLEALPALDWIVDCAAIPRVLAGVDGDTSSLVGHNLVGTLNLLEKCRRDRCGFILLSTSRVYAIEGMNALPLTVKGSRFALDPEKPVHLPATEEGLDEVFPSSPPVSLYGATKIASETMALEYAHNFSFPVHINRCGVLAGAGQFGTAEQGIFSYWVHSYRARAPLKFIGYGGRGLQVRDCLHPDDLARIVAAQLRAGGTGGQPAICNTAGGRRNSMSLLELTQWCEARMGRHPVSAEMQDRRLDVPWTILDCARAKAAWGWEPEIGMEQILDEIAGHAAAHPDWLHHYGRL